jgi:hypothetical protein
MKVRCAVLPWLGVTLLVSTEVVSGLSVTPSSSHRRVNIQARHLKPPRHNTELRITALGSSIQVQDPLFQQAAKPIRTLKGIPAMMTKIGMIMYIASMCATLPIALFPPFLLYKTRLITKMRQEQLSLRAGQFCARWLLKLIPFCQIKGIPHHNDDPEPSIWVCNHASALDVFMLLAADKTLRGKRKRPLKIVYVRKRTCAIVY